VGPAETTKRGSSLPTALPRFSRQDGATTPAKPPDNHIGARPGSRRRGQASIVSDVTGYRCLMSARDSVARAASSTGGQVLRAATKVITARPAAKPLHPRGSVVRGTLRRFGAGVGTGSAWLDQTGEDEVLVRQSRAVGLPSPAPDIFGLAVRVPREDGRSGDLLFATTGLGRLTRYTLTAARSPLGRPMSTLLPYRTPAGAVVMSAVFRDQTTVALAWAIASGAWHSFAELMLHQDPVDEADAPLQFDPVRNELPGLETYDWVRRLRAPAYNTARRSRGS
jgi:hypothetical protein